MTTFRSILSLVFASVMVTIQGLAQERAGLSLGHYNGVNATLLNPTSLLTSPHTWSANLAGGHLFGNTNYAYIENASLLRLAQESEEIIIEVQDRTSDDDLLVQYKKSGDSYVDVHAAALGPGFMMQLNDKTSIGVSTRGRVVASSFKIPEVYSLFTELDTSTVYSTPKYDGNAAAYSEINFHFARELSPNLAVGITGKYLMGLDALHFQNRTEFDLSKFDADNVDVLEQGSFDLHHSSPDENNISVSGHGIGFDLGVSLADFQGKAGTRIGISLVDIGFISYSGIRRRYSWDVGVIVDGANYENLSSADELDNQLPQDFNIVESSDRFGILLPTALSLQVEQKITDQFSVSGFWVQRLKLFANQLARSNSLNVTGLYERKHFSAYLPVSLYNYSELRVGAAVRVAYVTIGSDRLLSLFRETDFDGTDFYVNVQVYPFQLGKLGKGRKGAKEDKDVQCFDF